MPSAHGVTVTGSLSAPGAFAEALNRYGRRSVAQKLRRGGEATVGLATALANSELGASESGGRRRNKGVSYRGGFKATYTGLEEFGRGNMKITVNNRARHARIIEYGSSPHEIAPVNVEALSWPGMVSADWPDIQTLPKGRAVHHPGTRPYHIIQRAAALGLRQGIGDSAIHAKITFSTRGR